MSVVFNRGMSQVKPNVQQNPSLNMTMEQVTQGLSNAKRRISQRKGELADNLSDQITQELGQINQMCMQLFGEIQRLTAENEKLKGKEEPKKNGK